MSTHSLTRRDVTAAAAIAALVIGGVGGCFSDRATTTVDNNPTGNCVVPPVPAGATLVFISNFTFTPATVHVKSGNSVAFVNCEPTAIQHTATADGGRFDTGTLNQGKASVQSLTGAATIPYHCAIHPSMKATVIVDP